MKSWVARRSNPRSIHTLARNGNFDLLPISTDFTDNCKEQLGNPSGFVFVAKWAAAGGRARAFDLAQAKDTK
jgi:hypothetical protein